jgi:hypothetical protein
MQLSSQLLKVVDLTVHHAGDRARLVRQRRIAINQVDDREAVLAQGNAVAAYASSGIRPSVMQAFKLTLKCRL